MGWPRVRSRSFGTSGSLSETRLILLRLLGETVACALYLCTAEAAEAADGLTSWLKFQLFAEMAHDEAVTDEKSDFYDQGLEC